MTDDSGGQIPVLDDVVDMELDSREERRWIVLYEEDYEEFLFDAGDSLAVLVDCNQAVEVLRLASSIVGDLAPKHAPEQEPIDAMIERVEEVKQDDE